MNRTERAKRDAEIVALREQNYSMQDIADMLQLSSHAVQYACKKYNVAGKRSNKKARYVAPAIPKQKTEAEAAETVQQKLPAFEYVGNYTGSDGTADIRCKCCGTVITRSWVTIRHGKPVCPVCQHHETLQKQEQQKQIRQQEAVNKARQKKVDWFLNSEFPQRALKVCVVCGGIFVPRNSNQNACGSSCTKVLQNNHKKDKRLLQIKNVTVDKHITLEKLYQRDAGICYICGTVCDWSDYYVNKNNVKICGDFYPSIDHVKPLSKGGEHSWQNIRLAHRICNSLKGNTKLDIPLEILIS